MRIRFWSTCSKRSAVAHGGQVARVDLGRQRQPGLAPGRSDQRLDRLAHGGTGVERRQVEIEPLRFEPGELEEVFDQPLQAVGFPQRDPEVRVRSGSSGLERFEVATDQRDRRPQLVRHVGDQVAVGREQLFGAGPLLGLGRHRLLEQIGHLVELALQCGDFVLALDVDAGGEVAAGEPLGGLGQDQ